jgi:hypothetical protein
MVSLDQLRCTRMTHCDTWVTCLRGSIKHSPLKRKLWWGCLAPLLLIVHVPEAPLPHPPRHPLMPYLTMRMLSSIRQMCLIVSLMALFVL